MKHKLLLILFLQSILGCRTTDTNGDRNTSASRPPCVPQQQPSYQANQNTQGFAIVNGQTTVAWPSVVLLLSVDAKNDIGVCTGTFIGHNVIATAAHCVDKSVSGSIKALPGITTINIQDEVKNGHATIKSRGITPLQVITNGETKEQRILQNGTVANDAQIATDLALLILPPNSAPDIMALNTTAIQPNMNATIVGFGLTERNPRKIDPNLMKRQGTLLVNASTNFPGTLVSYSNPTGTTQVFSSAAQGDSGGPLIIANQLAGVVSVGATASLRRGGNESMFVDMTNTTVKTLLERARSAGAVFGSSVLTNMPILSQPQQMQQNCM